MVDILPGLFQS